MLRVLLVILALLLALAGALYVFLQVKLGEIGRVDDNNTADVSSADPDAMEWDEAQVATHVDGVVNILLVGQDSRSDTRERSDTMIILSVNTNSNQLTMVSLMRDLSVQVPGYGTCKLNAPYAYGGFDLLDQTISENFGVAIDYNVEVNFSGFKDIVDTLGGVDVELTEEEAAYLRGEGGNYVDGQVGRYTNGRTYNVTTGINHLDGQAALDYARARHADASSDFGRTQRQRKLLEIIFDDMKKVSWFKLLDIYDSVTDDITTDMTNNQIISIAFSAYMMGAKSINSYRIPATGMYYSTDYGGELNSMLEPNDWTETRQLLWDYLYSDDGGASAYAAMVEKYGEQSAMGD